MLVSAVPVLNVNDLFSGAGLNIERLFGGRPLYYFNLGRTALLQIALFLGNNNAGILIPDYICAEAIAPFKRSGVKISYYKIKKDLSIDMEDVESKIDARTKALLIVHYFGFPQKVEAVRSLCQRREILLIEDCTQALFSKYKDRYLGSYGDLTVFSFRKSLPLPDGGGLLINKIGIKIELLKYRKLRFKEEIMGLLRLIRNNLAFTFGYSLANWSLGKFAGGSKRVAEGEPALSMAALSALLMKRIDLFKFISRRRANYELISHLLAGLKGVSIICRNLPEGVCPFGFPILCENREKLLQYLLAQNIKAYPWTPLINDMFNDEHADAEYLSDHLLVLPVHQSIGNKHIRYIAEKIKEYIHAQ